MIALREQEKQKSGIGPALFLFVVFIFSGLYLAETQLNELTESNEFSKILNIKRDQQTKEVTAYFIGENQALGKWEYLKYDIDETELKIRVAENRIWRIPYQKWYAAAAEEWNDAKAAARERYAEIFRR